MQMVKVRLRKPRRVLTFLCENVHVERDQTCVVDTDRGLEWGTCVLPPEPCPRDMEHRIGNGRVLRCADDEDDKTYQVLEEEERKARVVCLEKIRQHNMDMKLVDVEYTFDKKKIVFYFTAEDRVDFRDLVRDLAHELRARIELRHIQVRDEARMVGGIGSCGRELCCASWLDEFKPISMRMAKRQNLSLNPSKISGQCGRLLCCLSYENDMYESAKRRARPKPQEEEAPRKEPEKEALPKPRAEEAPPAPREAKADAPAKDQEAQPQPVEAAAPDKEGQEGQKRSGRRRRRRRPRGGKKDGGAN